jgi:hypothetical protein
MAKPLAVRRVFASTLRHGHPSSLSQKPGPGLFWIIPLGIESARIIDIRACTISAERQETTRATASRSRSTPFSGMISEVGADNNSATVLMIPSDFVTLSKCLSKYLKEIASVKPESKS